VFTIGKAPAQSVPRILEFGLALNGLSISKNRATRVVATNREPRFIAPRRAGEESRKQKREQLGAPRQAKKEALRTSSSGKMAGTPSFPWLPNTMIYCSPAVAKSTAFAMRVRHRGSPYSPVTDG
jgi:hypothetical protein